MKKSTSTIQPIIYTFMLILFLGFAACKNKSKSTTKAPTPPPSTTVEVPPAPKLPEPPSEPVSEPSTPVDNSNEVEVPPPPPPVEKTFKGQSTYYNDSYHGKKTKTEELYDKNKYTCAIRLNAIPLPMGSVVEVYSIKRKKKVQVRVNDIMSNRAKAVIDLSRKAAEDIGLLIDGRTDVTIRVISEPQ